MANFTMNTSVPYLPPFQPPSLPPPFAPKPCRTIVPNYCDSLVESHYFDVNCYSYYDIYGNLGCNAGGLKCCRFCEFGHYINISCIESPTSPPPSPYPISPPPLPSLPPPLNPLIMLMPIIKLPPKSSKIEFNMRIASTIEAFDKNKFKRNLLTKLDKSISYKNILLRVRAGSLIVDIIILTNISIAQNTSNIIINMTPEILSNTLNVSVIEVSEPTIVNSESQYNILSWVYLLPLFLVLYLSYKLKNNTKNNTNKKTEKANKDSENKLDGVACLNTYKKYHNSNTNIDSFDENSDVNFGKQYV